MHLQEQYTLNDSETLEEVVDCLAEHIPILLKELVTSRLSLRF